MLDLRPSGTQRDMTRPFLMHEPANILSLHSADSRIHKSNAELSRLIHEHQESLKATCVFLLSVVSPHFFFVSTEIFDMR